MPKPPIKKHPSLRGDQPRLKLRCLVDAKTLTQLHVWAKEPDVRSMGDLIDKIVNQLVELQVR